MTQESGGYWRRKWQAYEQRSDETPEADSQDLEDHSVWLTDPNVFTYTKKKYH